MFTAIIILGIAVTAIVAAYGLLDRARPKALATQRETTQYRLAAQRAHEGEAELGMESALPFLCAGTAADTGI